MTPATIEAISAIAKNDPTTTEEEKKLIRSLVNGTNTRRKKMINRKEVMQLLAVSAPTLRKLIKSGKITEIKISSRKSRFDYEQVVSFLENGCLGATNE
ncbi:MAG: helix-turn-helix domain-containing protein [Victivallales bacterium]|nr:helix-turn-helix domain-containing protein [Victivallales bacterium]